MCLLMLSSKYEEIYPPSIAAFANVAKYSPKEFLKLEVTLLDITKWKLMTSTSADYISRFSRSAKCSNKSHYLSTFILEASSQANISFGEDKSIFNPSTLRWLKDGQTGLTACTLHLARPSNIALGCIILSLAYQGKVCYPDALKQSAGLNVKVVGNIVKQLHTQLKVETEKYGTRSSAVVAKYLLSKYHKIGAFKPPGFHELLACKAFRDTELSGFYRLKSTKHTN